ALVPGHGVAPSWPRPSTWSSWSRTSICVPVSTQPPADLAPTAISNGAPVVTGEGIDHTARLDPWPRVQIGTRSAPVCVAATEGDAADASANVHTCSPTDFGAVSGTSPYALAPSSAVASTQVTALPSGAVTLSGRP